MGHLGSSLFGQMAIPTLKEWVPTNLQQREFAPNKFNACLNEEYDLWRHINRCGGLQQICPGHNFPEPPWVKMPAQGKHYVKTGSIALPPNDGNDYLVMSYQVPNGFDGVIVSTVNNYNGQNYIDGSGDFSWRLKLNLHYVKDFGNLQTQIGTNQTPWGVNSGQIILLSGQTVQFYVNRDVNATQEVGGYILCTCAGWFWPR